MSKSPPAEHFSLAWHLLLEHSRYEGKDFKASLKSAFKEIESKYNEDTPAHQSIREEVAAVRKELNLG